MPDRFANELALFEPDIINFSESPSEEVVKQIAKRLGTVAGRGLPLVSVAVGLR